MKSKPPPRSPRVRDDDLRRRAFELLGPDGQEDARDALEAGALEIEPEVTTWAGSAGTVHGHRVYVVVPAELLGRVASSMMAQDSLSYAIAAALAERTNEALFDLRYEAGERDARFGGGGGPYR